MAPVAACPQCSSSGRWRSADSVQLWQEAVAHPAAAAALERLAQRLAAGEGQPAAGTWPRGVCGNPIHTPWTESASRSAWPPLRGGQLQACGPAKCVSGGTAVNGIHASAEDGSSGQEPPSSRRIAMHHARWIVLQQRPSSSCWRKGSTDRSGGEKAAAWASICTIDFVCRPSTWEPSHRGEVPPHFVRLCVWGGMQRKAELVCGI